MDGEDGIPWARLPERLDRRLRLGPFPSARDALKFVLYAAAGALLVPFTGPFVWVAIAGLGFAIAVWRPDGGPWDERAAAFVLWRVRRRAGSGTVTRRATGPAVERGLLGIEGGPHCAILRAGGIPIDYLPPTELHRRFAEYRELLLALDGSFGWTATIDPIRSSLVLPEARPTSEPEAWGRDGYRGLVEAICRRRGRRRIDWVLSADVPGTEGVAALERRIELVVQRLSACGVPIARLTGRRGSDAARRLGWPARSAHP
jgi:hypothetical protein